MLKTLCPLLLALAGATSAHAGDTRDANAAARLQLAAAEAPGDLLSDAYLVPMIDLALEADGKSGELDPALRASLVQARDELAQRVDAAEAEVPAALFATVQCLRKDADVEQCDDSRERMAEIAGDNAYHHFVLMSTAAERGDDEAFARHARRMLAAPAYEPDMLPVFASLYRRYSELPASFWQQAGGDYGPESAPGIQAMAIAAAVVLPGYRPFTQACEEDNAERRALCVAVARHMAERSPVLLDRLIGVGLIKKYGTPAEKAAASELEREAMWLHAGMAHFDSELGDEQLGRYFDIFADEGEFAAMRYAAQATGRSLEPPADWQP